MCIPQAGAGQADNAMINMVRKTNVGKMVDGNNRKAYVDYSADAQMNGIKPVSYEQWQIQNRHSR
jgi:hypothetical protein